MRYMFGLLIAAVCVGGPHQVVASDGAKPVYPAYQVKVDGREMRLYAETVAFEPRLGTVHSLGLAAKKN